MTDPAEFWSSFAYDGTPIRKADPHKLGERVPNESAMKILTEIGLPEQLGYELFFFPIHKEPLTWGEFWRQRGRSESTEVDGFLYVAAGDDDGIILDGAGGRMYSWNGNRKLLINRTLADFTEFLRLIRESMNAVEESPSAGDQGHLPNLTERLVERFHEIDPEGMKEGCDYWKDITGRLFFGE